MSIQFVGLCKHCGGAMYYDFDNNVMVPHGGFDCICEFDEELAKEMHEPENKILVLKAA